MVINLARVDLKYFIAPRDLLIMEKNRETSLAQLDLNCMIPTSY